MEAVLFIHTAQIQSVTGMRRFKTVVPKGGSGKPEWMGHDSAVLEKHGEVCDRTLCWTVTFVLNDQSKDEASLSWYSVAGLIQEV